MAKYKVTNGELVKEFASLENAIAAADNSGQGYKVYNGTNLVYEQVTPNRRLVKSRSAVLAKAKEMTGGMAKIPGWYYSNSGCAGTYKSAISGAKYKSNCATLANWIFRSLKITKTGEYFYGKAGSIISWRGDTEASVKQKCDVFNVGVTVKKALDLGMLQPGDVCCYAKQHTNVYGGGTKWYESGTVYADGSGKEGTPLHKFYGNTVLYDWVISYVLRYDDPAYKVKGREYRIQCGSFSSKSNAKALRNKLKAANIPVTIVTQSGEYIVQTGRFTQVANAVKRYKVCVDAKFDCMIKGI